MVNKVTLMRENFLDILSLQGVRKDLNSKNQTDHLFQLLYEYTNGIDENQTEFTVSNNHELEMRIPGTVIHVQLTGLLKSKLQDIVAIYLILSGASDGNWVKLTVGIIIAFLDRVKKLKIERGELCIIETLSKTYNRSSEGDCIKLFGNKCLYPSSMCQFMKSESKTCQFDESSIKSTMMFLKEKKILKQQNAIDPIQWAIVT